ncbi:MAG: hypothetical protein BWY77_01718 [bacterium ADurb.Bin431]|nr:MAG: hypothetical protein BWY77_01718 [bacterium ADurb.Bin431]
MDINQSRRGPDPVVLGQTFAGGGIGELDVGAVLNPRAPFDPGKVDPPVCARPRSAPLGSLFLQYGPGQGQLDRPAGVGIAGLIDAALYDHPLLQSADIPEEGRIAAIAVGAVEIEVPVGGEGVEFEFVIAVGVAVRIDKDLEIVVIENDRIVFAQRRPDVGLLHLAGDVEIVVIPKHFHAGVEARPGLLVALDIDKGLTPGCALPVGLPEIAVDNEGAGSPAADVLRGREGHFGQLERRERAGRAEEQGNEGFFHGFPLVHRAQRIRVIGRTCRERCPAASTPSTLI